MYGHVITTFSRMVGLPHFLTHGAPFRALRARELRYKTENGGPLEMLKCATAKLIKDFGTIASVFKFNV